MRHLAPVVLAALTLVAACSSGPAREPAPTPAPTPAPAPSASEPAPAPSQPPPSPAALSWGPEPADLRAAREAVAAMTPEQLAGQVVVARYAGIDPATAAGLVSRHHLAGVILMGDNVAAPGQIRATADAVQAAVTAGARRWPGIVAVDQEGGTVARVRAPATEFPAFLTHGAAQDAAVTRAAAAASGAELRSLGFTLVFAPVADVTSGPDDPTIGSRSASDDAARVSAAVAAALAGYGDAGIVAVAKHYPGHGSVPADSHETLPVQTASADELAATDLVPFAAAVRAGVPAVMMSHIAVRAWDPGVPASLSPAAYEALRGRTGFEGVAVTDALDMAAVAAGDGPGAAGDGPGAAAVRALAAGADLLLMPADTAAAVGAVATALDEGRLPRARVEEAAARVVALMTWAGRAPAPATDAVGTHGEQSYAASLAGLTVVDGPCSGRLVGNSVQILGGTEEDRERFAEAAAAAGLGTGKGDVVRLLGGSTSSGSGDVVVALDAPYGLGASIATTARIALYGRTPAAFAALADVLVGRATGSGTLPVQVEGLPGGASCG